jgi:uncharacterized protein with GYD domain
MRFILLGKFKEKATKEIVARHLKFVENEEANEGIKWIDTYWTLGRYDAVAIIDAPDEKAAMKVAIRRDYLASETLVAIPAVEARKLVE